MTSFCNGTGACSQCCQVRCCEIDEYNIHLMCAPEGNSEFCFPESLDVSRDEVEGNIETRMRKQNSLFPSGAHIKCFVI